MNTLNSKPAGLENPQGPEKKEEIKKLASLKIVNAIFELSKGEISKEKLFGHEHLTFSPEQQSAAGVLGLGKMYSLFSKQVYDEVLDPSKRYDTRK